MFLNKYGMQKRFQGFVENDFKIVFLVLFSDMESNKEDIYLVFKSNKNWALVKRSDMV